MSKQLAISVAFSVLMMATYVLFGADAAHESLTAGRAVPSPVEVSAPALPAPATLLPSLR